MRTVSHFLLTLALLLTGCATTTEPTGQTPDLSGTRWFVTRIDDKPPLHDVPLMADFTTEGRINGDSGCNNFSGPYIQNGSTVQIGELLSTRRACVDSAVQRQESRLLDILQGASMARLQKGELHLRTDDGSLVLSPASLSIATSAAPRRVQFDCEGVGLTILFDGGRASMVWQQDRDVLDQRPTASGVWYESPRNSLRGKQDLLWTLDGGMPRTCHELR